MTILRPGCSSNSEGTSAYSMTMEMPRSCAPKLIARGREDIGTDRSARMPLQIKMPHVHVVELAALRHVIPTFGVALLVRRNAWCVVAIKGNILGAPELQTFFALEPDDAKAIPS